ncbi:hypothetical protein ACFQO7_18150 [Catellatospora aurea]|uniref:Mce-associated membrane protein n=1 Tax=Catellatospora aurea TaxID=1337874 RepID=A0ABW2H0B3_9ACTN
MTMDMAVTDVHLDDAPGDESRDEPARRPRRAVLALSLAIAVVVGVGWFLWFDQQRAGEAETAARECAAVAPAAAVALFSYDYRTFDESAASGRAFAAGAFADEYARTTASLKEAAVKEQAVVTAQVTGVSVVTAAPDRVELLLFVNQYRRNVNITGEKVDQNRVVLTLVRTGGAWKVTAVSAL